MTAATLAEPIRDARSIPLSGGLPGSRTAASPPESDFKAVLRGAQGDGPLAKATDAAAGEVKRPEAAVETPTQDPEAAPTAVEGASGDSAEVDAHEERSGSADVAPEAQDSHANSEDGAEAEPAGEGGGATSDAAATRENTPGEMRESDASSRPSVMRGPGESAGGPGHAPEHAPATHEATSGQTRAAAPAVSPAVVDAPPTVHRINELLLTLDPRDLRAAGVQGRGPAAGEDTVTGQTSPDAHLMQNDRASRSRAFSSALPEAKPAGTTAAGNSDEGAQVDQRAVMSADSRHTEARPSGEGDANRSAAMGRADAAPAPAAAAVATAADNRGGEQVARVDAALSGLLRLAASASRSVDSSGTNAGYSANGGLGDRQGGAGDVKAGAASRAGSEAAPRAEQTFQAQLSRGLAAAVAQRGGRLTLRLAPEALGEVKIDMTIKEGTVSARFEAATSEARELLGRSMEHLRETLHAKGLHVERLEVREHAAEPVRNQAGDADQPADADAGARQHGRDREDPGSRSPRAAVEEGWIDDAAEAALVGIGGAPEDHGDSAWRFGVDAIA